MDFTHHQTLDLQERLDSLMNGRTPWLLGSGEWRSHLPSGYGLAQRMKSSWPCSKQRFLQRNPESSRNDSNLIHSSEKMNKNATRSPGLLVLQPPTRLPKACKTCRWCGSSGRCSWSWKHVGCWPNSGRAPNQKKPLKRLVEDVPTLATIHRRVTLVKHGFP